MPVSSFQRFAALPSLGLLAGLLAACSGTTYGTGVSPEEQTITDLVGIASLGSSKQTPIDYRPRGNIAVPPNPNVLPTPGSGPTLASAEADPNWPKDPDQEARARKAAKDASFGKPSPNFVLPAGQTSIGNAQAMAAAQGNDAQRRAEGKQAWDELHKAKTGSVDANGNPVRKYLTEPPVAYREPDPNAPMSDPPKKKMSLNLSKLWPW
ncbi:MAG: hypothetical protein J0I45_21690 [Bosea sp.]|nr:hypothetical protein [Bosea sp. (in: a-proteobacteria)]